MDPSSQVPPTQDPALPLPQQPPQPVAPAAPSYPAPTPAQAPVAVAQPVFVAPLAPVATAQILQSQVTYEPNLFRWQPKYPGTLQWDGQGISFTDQAGTRLLDIPIASVEAISQRVVFLSVKALGKRHNFNFGGEAVALAGALVGGLVAPIAINSAVSKAGIEKWVHQARMFSHIKSGKTEKEGWILTFKITAALVVLLVIIALLG